MDTYNDDYEDNDEVYAVIDLNGYAQEMRQAAAKTISSTTDNNLDDYMTINEMIRIVNDSCLGFDNEHRPLLNEEVNETIFENAISWIHEIGLAKLAAQDLVECAWDNDTNEMIFWQKESSNNESKSRRKNKKS